MLVKNDSSGELEPALPEQLKYSKSKSSYDFRFPSNIQPACYEKGFQDSKETLIFEKVNKTPKVWSSEYKCGSPVIPRVYPTWVIRPLMFCEVYEIGFKVVSNREKKSRFIPTAIYCTNTMDVIYTKEYLTSLDLLHKMRNFDTVDHRFVGMLKIRKQEEIDYLYSLENQNKAFTTIFEDGWTARKYFDEKHKYLQKQELIDQRNHILPVYKLSALFYANLAPMYKSIKSGSWDKIQNYIRNALQGDYTASILTGTRGTLTLDDQQIFLKPKERVLRVPETFYKIITLQIGIKLRSIAIVTHNNPFKIPQEKICTKVLICEDYGWKLTNTNPIEGYTYCCNGESFVKDDLKHLAFETGDVLNLKILNKLYQEELEEAKERNK